MTLISTPTLPDSLAAMHDDPDLMQGVFTLAEKLNGTKMVARTWANARSYAKALTMAAVARGDYAVMMYDLWESVFAEAGVDRVGHIDTDPSAYSPAEVWNHEEISKLLTLPFPMGKVAKLNLGIRYELVKRTLRLELNALDSKDEQVPVPKALETLDGWHLDDEYEWDEKFLFSRRINATDFSDAITTAREEAAKLIVAIEAAH